MEPKDRHEIERDEAVVGVVVVAASLAKVSVLVELRFLAFESGFYYCFGFFR